MPVTPMVRPILRRCGARAVLCQWELFPIISSAISTAMTTQFPSCSSTGLAPTMLACLVPSRTLQSPMLAWLAVQSPAVLVLEVWSGCNSAAISAMPMPPVRCRVIVASVVWSGINLAVAVSPMPMPPVRCQASPVLVV